MDARRSILRTATVLLGALWLAGGCSPESEGPRQRRAALQALFEQVRSEELQRQLRSDPRLAGRRAAEQTAQAFPTASSAALAASIRYSRAQARRSGVRPIPPEIRKALAPYFEADLLDSVRWTTAGARVSLGTLLVGWYDREAAVTLGDTVVFSNTRMAAQRGLWAHELTHVEQYDALGIDGFAALYTTDWPELERRAGDNALEIKRRIRENADG